MHVNVDEHCPAANPVSVFRRKYEELEESKVTLC
jgi:hypothetical protein